MPLSGESGFDLYIKKKGEMSFHKNIKPIPSKANYAEGILAEKLPEGMKECLIYLPLYNGVKKMTLGIDPDSEISAPEQFAILDPVLFYGSSITQGGCASRPGNAYTHFLTRWLNSNMINLGFSGSGRGEDIMAQAISELKLSAFVMDYDHNAPDVAHLEKTHERFFRIIREKQPELPVVMVSRCDFDPNPEDSAARRAVIQKTTTMQLLPAIKTSTSSTARYSSERPTEAPALSTVVTRTISGSFAWPKTSSRH
jgi:hypothetical protein